MNFKQLLLDFETLSFDKKYLVRTILNNKFDNPNQICFGFSTLSDEQISFLQSLGLTVIMKNKTFHVHIYGTIEC
jgi:hypothetical protein